MFASYQYPTYDSTPEGGLGTQADYVLNPTTDGYEWQHSYCVLLLEESAVSGQRRRSRSSSTPARSTTSSRRASTTAARSTTRPPVGRATRSSVTRPTRYVVRNVRTIYKTQYYSGTLGDTLTAGNLTINAGVRYDVQLARTSRARPRAIRWSIPTTGEVILPPVIYQGDTDSPFNYKDWQPRVSAALLARQGPYDPAARLLRPVRRPARLPHVPGQRTVADERLLLLLERLQRRQHRLARRDRLQLRQPSASTPWTRRLAPIAGQPRSHPTSSLPRPTSSRSASTSRSRTTSPSRRLTRTATSRTSSTRLPIGAGPDTWFLQGTAQGVAVADNGFTLPFNVPFYALTLEDEPIGDNFFNRPGATQNFNGIEFSAVKRLSNKWMLRGSVGWNNWRQQIPPEAVVDPNNRWNLAGQNTNNGLVVGYSGKDYIWINARWQFNVSGMYQFPLGINFSANFFGREGYPQSYYIRNRQIDGAGSRQRNLVRPDRLVPPRQRLPARPAPGEGVQHRPGDLHRARRGASTSRTTTPSCSASATRAPGTSTRSAGRRTSHPTEPSTRSSRCRARPSCAWVRASLSSSYDSRSRARPARRAGPFLFIDSRPCAAPSSAAILLAATLVSPAGKQPAASRPPRPTRDPSRRRPDHDRHAALRRRRVRRKPAAARRRTSTGSPRRAASSRGRTRTTSSRSPRTPTS